MTRRTGVAIALLVMVQALAGCDDPAPRPLPVAPAPVPPAPPPPQPAPHVEGYTLTLSAETVSAGAELTVSWTAPISGKLDWIGIFPVGAANCNYGDYWYTDNETSGTLAVKAPSRPGQYEFRYHLDDGCVETVRSSPLTVTAAG